MFRWVQVLEKYKIPTFIDKIYRLIHYLLGNERLK